MSILKILTLVHKDCVPPEKATMKDADWANWKTEFYVKRTLKKLGHEVKVLGVSDDLSKIQDEVGRFSPDIVFNLLEEFQGEAVFEGHIVSLLELMGVPYTGCNPHGLSLGRDKALTKKVLNYHGILTPGFFVVKEKQRVKVPENMKFPMIVKSLIEEASLGISQDSIVRSVDKLAERVQFIHESIGTPALVEEYVEGRELYIGVLGNSQIKVLPPWELTFGDLADGGHPIATRNVKFSKKYCEKHGVKRGLAKSIDDATLKKISNVCRGAFKALKLNGYARMDLRLNERGEIYFLEVNPNAELANGECLANAARHAGMSYEQLIAKILSLGLSWKDVA